MIYREGDEILFYFYKDERAMKYHPVDPFCIKMKNLKSLGTTIPKYDSFEDVRKDEAGKIEKLLSKSTSKHKR